MDVRELQREVNRIRWWHQIELAPGVVTPGRDQSAKKLARLHLPARLDGLSVLDIGAWDGFFSFECERRGAARVVAVDSFVWQGCGWGSKAGFELARRVLHSRVEDRNLDVAELTPEAVGGTFDLVLLLGVLYHLKNPWAALARVADVTHGRLILETHVDLLHMSRPAVALYPGNELRGDSTNWCGPNLAALRAMLTDVGFSRVTVVEGPSWARRFGRALIRGPLWPTLTQDRVVVHAWRAPTTTE